MCREYWKYVRRASSLYNCRCLYIIHHVFMRFQKDGMTPGCCKCCVWGIFWPAYKNCRYHCTSCEGVYVMSSQNLNPVILFFVQCMSTVLCNDGDIRLVGGTLEEEGRVEICINEVWGTVCDDFFTTADANVACGQLGYSKYSELCFSSSNLKCKMALCMGESVFHYKMSLIQKTGATVFPMMHHR